MRKLFLYMLAAFMLNSCDNLKKKDKTSTEDDTEEISKAKKKKALDDEEENTDEDKTPKKKKKTMDEDEELQNTTDDDEPVVVRVTPDGDDLKAETRWTSADRKQFMRECTTSANANLGEERINQYCNCVLEKVEKDYVSYKETAKMTKAELNKVVKECNGQ